MSNESTEAFIARLKDYAKATSGAFALDIAKAARVIENYKRDAQRMRVLRAYLKSNTDAVGASYATLAEVYKLVEGK